LTPEPMEKGSKGTGGGVELATEKKGPWFTKGRLRKRGERRTALGRVSKVPSERREENQVWC